MGVPILQYLGARSEEVFTADEILDALLYIYERRATPAEVVVVLGDLVDAKLLETKQFAGVVLYAITNRP